MLPEFYCVVTNRDRLKMTSGEMRPLWEFIDGEQGHWLTSLVYLRNMAVPPGRRFLDCGAWSYKGDHDPKWSPAECADRYAAVATDGDLVAAPDHMILRDHDEAEQERRRAITIANAKEFLVVCPPGPVPVGVIHGRDIAARVGMAEAMLDFGYTYLAVGSIANQAGNRKYVHALLDAMADLKARRPFRMHVLGISALSWVREFPRYGVDSYDGSAMFFAAFTGATFYAIDAAGDIVKHKVKGVDPETIPACDCPACSAMRAQGDDTRTMGSNERNMGRAIHNINVYLKAKRTLVPAPRPDQGGLFS